VSQRPLRVVLADDDVLLREGLASLLERSGFEVIGQAGNSIELLALARSARPGVAIIDIRMPPGQATEGLEAARVIREELPGTAVVVLSAHVEVNEAMDLLESGERVGYLLKSRVTDVAEFIGTVGRIAAGASVVDPSLVQELVRARRRRDPLDVLSQREREVLALMAEGASNAGIAQRIFVTEGTVEKHIRSILMKLDLPDSETEHRRVLAVLKFLEARLAQAGPVQPAAVALSARPAAAEQFDDRMRREPRFRHEADRRAGGDEIGEILLGVGRDHDHPRAPARRAGQLFRHVEPALPAQPGIDEDEIRVLLLSEAQGLGAGPHAACNGDPLSLQQQAGSLQELGTVVHNHGAQGHPDYYAWARGCPHCG
jgi:DNA-binding NarL/FixJ family response regulator